MHNILPAALLSFKILHNAKVSKSDSGSDVIEEQIVVGVLFLCVLTFT